MDKSDPPLARCSNLYSGRIAWVRSLQMRMDDVMNILKAKKCVIEHHKMQPTIQYYNSLSFTFQFYEMQQHKTWYDSVDNVLNYLSQPVLVQNKATNRLAVNFHPVIFELIRESEQMMKLKLGIFFNFYIN